MNGGATRRLVQQHLADPGSGWSMGTIGAIAEFVRDPDEPVTSTGDGLVTARGGIRVTVPLEAAALAYETPAGPHDHWNHAVALCLPGPTARQAARASVTELGPDRAALLADDRAGVLFDLGLGTPTVDVCVRTADHALIALLRAAAGTSLFTPGSTLAADLVAAGPHRVFATACGRIEVYAAIPPPQGRSPDGPHTHLLPHLLRTGRTHAATVPVPEGYLPCAHLYPPHPLTDLAGRPRPFDTSRHRAFQGLLARFGDHRQIHAKAATVTAVRAGVSLPPATGPIERAAVAVTLRQLGHIDGPSPTLAAARARHGTPAELLDPDGDRNGG
jgi:hypothetical protein